MVGQFTKRTQTSSFTACREFFGPMGSGTDANPCGGIYERIGGGTSKQWAATNSPKANFLISAKELLNPLYYSSSMQFRALCIVLFSSRSFLSYSGRLHHHFAILFIRTWKLRG